MALNLRRVPLLRINASRGYVQAVPVCGNLDSDPQSSVLSNKMTAASIQNDSAITRVSVIFKAGSRYEQYDNLGTSHFIRLAAGLSTSKSSQFAIMRNIQQVGAQVSAIADREYIQYILEGTQEAVDKVMPFFTDMTTQQAFKPWELDQLVTRAKIELANRPPQQRAIDLLHKAAFRTGLGNSIYTSKHQMGRMNSESLLHYANTTMTAGRAAIVGTGVDHAILSHYAAGLNLPSGDGDAATPSPYKGGEIRSDKGSLLGSPYAFVAIGGEGGRSCDLKERTIYGVLARALGGAPNVKYAVSDNGPLSETLGKSNAPAAISAFSASYADAGLFGVLIAAEARAAGSVVDGVLGVFQRCSLSEEAVQRGKNQLKRELLTKFESGNWLVRHMGAHALLSGATLVPGVQSLAQLVDGISTQEVNAAFKRVAASKLSIASVGDLRTVPFRDDMK